MFALASANLNNSTLSYNNSAVITSLHCIDQLLERRRSSPEAWDQLLIRVFGRSAAVDLSVITIEILDGQIMTGLHGAYGPITPNGDERIYLNADWLAKASQDDIEALLLEELDYAIDHRVHGYDDTPGNQGAILSGVIHSIETLGVETAKNDHHNLIMKGQAMSVD